MAPPGGSLATQPLPDMYLGFKFREHYSMAPPGGSLAAQQLPDRRTRPTRTRGEGFD